MRVHLHAIGKRMPGWIETGIGEYAKRLPAGWDFRLVEHGAARGETAALRKARDADTLLAAIDAREHVVALDERGREGDTAALAQRLERWQALGKPLSLVIGGADGLAPALTERANETLSLGRLTFPHPLVRVMLIEQLYRAWSLNAGHPYHRA